MDRTRMYHKLCKAFCFLTRIPLQMRPRRRASLPHVHRCENGSPELPLNLKNPVCLKTLSE